MSEFTKTKRKAATKAALAAAAGTTFLASEAAAAETTPELVDASQLNSVASMHRLDDGRLELTLKDGSTVILGEDQFVENAGQFLLTQDALANLAGSNGTLLLVGGAVLAVGAIALASGGGDDAPAPMPAPELDQNVPTDGDDVLMGDAGDNTIDGLGGDDTIDGLAGNDTLIGSGGNDTLNGGAGDDILRGGGGADALDGGEGNDTASFSDIGQAVTVDLAAGTADYESASDTLANIENVEGSAQDDVIVGDANANILDGADGNDVLRGGAGNDTLIGGAGDDVLAGGGGADMIDGGDGIDTNSFEGIGMGVTATVNADGTGTAEYGMVSESFTGIENLSGSDNDDVLIATGAAANVIEGGAGDDLIAGGGGVDVLDGGEGNDTNSFQGIGVGVTANLGDGTASYGMVNEIFTNFENLRGSDNDDSLRGDGNVNIIEGEAGNDRIIWSGGEDTLDGGEGVDTLDYETSSVGVDIQLGAGTATRTLMDGTVEVDTISNFENAVGSSFDDTLRGNGADNVLEGGAGDDTLVWSGGEDTLNGGEGFDTADYTTSSVPVIFDLDENGNGTVTRDIGFGVTVTDAEVADDATFIEAAEAGNLYFNVHTEEFNGGEIRGQLSVTSDETTDGVRTIVLDATLDATQEPMGASDSDATGVGQVTITVDADGNATYSSTLDIVGISPSELITLGNGALSAIHLHNAPAGQNGPVLQDIVVDAGGATDGTTADGDVFAEVTEVDTLISIEQVILSDNNDTANPAPGDQVINGGDGDDVLLGGAGNDTLDGGAGDDIVGGGGGFDALSGGEGNDTLTFSGIGRNVDANLSSGTAIYVNGAGVTVEETHDGFENLEGFIGNDRLTGDSGDNILDGGAGNDTLVGGAGNDTLIGGAGDDLLRAGPGQDSVDGGEGIDTIDVSDIPLDVEVNLAEGTASYGMVEETVVNVENIIGSEGDDTLTGDDQANNIAGNAGDDIINGGAGDDILRGDAIGDGEAIQITIENTLPEGGTFLTPVWFGFNDGAETGFSTYVRGEEASRGLESLAEDGSVAAIATEFSQATGDRGVDATVFGLGAGAPGPIDPGETATFVINVNPDDVGEGNFVWATMVIPSNDAFLSSPGNPLADPIFSSDGEFLGPIEILRFGSDVLDAGTEVNTELDAAFLNQMGANTGEDENGVVALHVGFNGSESNPDGTPVNILGGTTAAGTVVDPTIGDFTLNGGQQLVLRILVDRAVIEGNDTIDGGAGDDYIDGGFGDDVLIGGSGNDTILGGAGDDIIRAGGGRDTTDGGEGVDTFDSSDLGVAVQVDLGAETAVYGSISETAANFENAIGTAQDDTIRGSGAENVIETGAGDDTIIWTGGEDVYDGGEGFDTVDYTTSSVPVVVELDADGNGTATRELGFDVAVSNAEVADDAVFVQAALDGNLYFNVHTEEFPMGEIRGQLSVTSDETVEGVRTIVLNGDLDSTQEPMEASDSEASGSATITITVDVDGNASYSGDLSIAGISPSELITLGNGALSAIHLHNAPAGQNGPVLQDYIVDAGGDVEGNAVDMDADTGDGDVFVEDIQVDTLISVEQVIGQGGEPIISAPTSQEAPAQDFVVNAQARRNDEEADSFQMLTLDDDALIETAIAEGLISVANAPQVADALAELDEPGEDELDLIESIVETDLFEFA